MHRPDLEEWADNRFLSDPAFSKRKTFGCPSYYRGKKMAAFVHEDSLCIKLTPERVKELSKKDPDVYEVFSPRETDGI